MQLSVSEFIDSNDWVGFMPTDPETYSFFSVENIVSDIFEIEPNNGSLSLLTIDLSDKRYEFERQAYTLF